MSNWVTLPVETIANFQGKTLQTPQLDDDLESIFHPIKCSGCDFESTNLKEFQSHITDHDEDLDLSSISISPITVDLDTPHLIFQVLVQLSKDETLNKIQKNNDSYQAGETWKAAWLARGKDEVKIHRKQYKWLHELLDRKLPKGDREESLTVATFIFGLNAFASVQALTLTEERNNDQDE